MNEYYHEVLERAKVLARFGSVGEAVAEGSLPQVASVSLSEALVLGLFNQGVRKYIGILGHGNTDIANILALYEEAGVVRMFNVRHEVEAAHSATMLRWHYRELAAVLTSIGPGALHAFAGSLAAASNGIGVYHIYGDETTHDEGPNMQQIPKSAQASFLELAKTMGQGYQVHTPESIFTALRWGATTVFHPYSAGPYYLLMPMNIQPVKMYPFNLLELPGRPAFPEVACAAEESFREAVERIRASKAVTIKFGGGAAGCGPEIQELADLSDAVVVSGAKMAGVVPYRHPRFVGVGGSKGTPCGNYAMNHADLVIVIGARQVCQWDCSGTAWKQAHSVISFNTEPYSLNHYNRTLPVLGHARPNLRRLIDLLKKEGFKPSAGESEWLRVNRRNKEAWEAFKRKRYENPVIFDPTWGREVLTQPAAIRLAYDFAHERRAACYFDAGDVQANGFQAAEEEEENWVFSDTGSSYMGLAVSALLAGALADHPVYAFAFSGDGSFTMNPQILFDGVEHGVRGCILLFDNRSMAAITGLQEAQYRRAFKTSDSLQTDYVSMADSIKGVRGIFGGYSPRAFSLALAEAYAYPGLALIHLPVYTGTEELGGLGVYGSWNVGSWCEEVQAEHHRLGL
jgi:3D-(3,5/4)-trihydroxycyclohexane-1,2-dione acylhydrolase (decyclizing)